MVIGGLYVTEESVGSENLQQTIFKEMTEFSLLVKKMVKLVPMDSNRNVRIRIGIHCGDLV